ncbi:MAG: HD domain-containing protein [Phycisphaerales bacterium]|nr:HD domain-containing protein [Phycisphaerales bacterium]
MNIRRAPKVIDPFPQEFIDRCCDMGLMCWRLDLNGMPIEDPIGPSMLGMWLSSRPLRMLMTEGAMHWSAQDYMHPFTPHPGLWVFPFVELHRERRTGFFVAIGFGPEIFQSELIHEGCKGNQLQNSALLHLLRDRAKIQEMHTDSLMSTLSWMLGDLRSLRKHDETIELFSEQLGESYEVVTTLQDLGRSMGALHEPNTIIEDGIAEIAATLDYNFVACCINELSDVSAVLDEKILQAGMCKLSDEQINTLIEYVNTNEPLGNADTTNIYTVPEGFEDLEPQILVHPIDRGGSILGYLIAGGKNGDDPQVSSHETKLMESISGMLGAALENAELYHRQHLTFLGTVKALSAAIDAKDQYTQGHSERVAMLSAMLASRVGFSDEEAERIRISGLVHDVGKIGVPESVLCKPSRLTDEEFEMIKRHPTIGYEIIKDIPDLQDVLPGVLHHHERWDGRGYPGGLSGEDIPRMARIMALADTFDAMSSNRAYRTGMDREKVFAEFRKCAGSQFDPELVEPFLSLDFSIYDDMVSRHKAQSPVMQRPEAA